MFNQLSKRISRLFSPSREDLAADDEKRSGAQRGQQSISQVVPREKAVLFGVIQSLTYYPEQIRPLVDATLFDGTGTIVLRWPGRTDIPGMHAGSHVEVEGTVGSRNGVLLMTNPLYRLIADDHVE